MLVAPFLRGIVRTKELVDFVRLQDSTSSSDEEPDTLLLRFLYFSFSTSVASVYKFEVSSARVTLLAA